VATEPISEFFDREACCRARRRGGDVSGVSRTLLHLLLEVGLRDRSVLELGSGTGQLSAAMLRGGASRVTGVDLSPRSVEEARERVDREGLGERASFLSGDAAATDLPRRDVVVLDKVFCCYPDAERLLGASMRAAGTVYGFVLPASEGLRGALSRVAVWFENTWRALRRVRFRAFVHEVPRIDVRLRAAGFVPLRSARRWVWHVAVYERKPPVPEAVGAVAATAMAGSAPIST
jgi:magnesium-protoporphyrin O-methyltransferase